GLTPAGSLRFELENRIFASGMSQAELDPGGQVVHGPLLRALYGPERTWGVVDSALDPDGSVLYTLSPGGRIVSGWGASPRVLVEGLRDPCGIALDNQGIVFVCEAASGRVLAVLGGGEVLPVGTDLGEPVDLTWLPGLGVAVVDRSGGRLILLGSRGQRVLRQDLREPVAVARLPDGDLAVVEAGADRVVRISPDGQDRGVLHTTAPGQLRPPEASFRVLGGLAVDPVAGVLYVSVPGRRGWVGVPLR
ncbi:MAG: hypothetical protein AB1758_34385, partial [Candidatus Eremiobacterota bacterium]